ncbi:MAG: SDR family NAD(P)-dependent oxidoreductase [Firmicutes bacterium]|nr:SDR family NAD(P)-dependent oxidoreductase [Bacillota bacterium]
MKVLVTGGAGFIGSHVADLLCAHGYAVSIIDNLSTGRVSNLPQEATFFHVDLTDFDEIRQVVEAVRPDYLIHLAAQVDVTTSLTNPLIDASTNILGSLNLFQVAYQVGVKRIVYASSAAVYGDPAALPLSEDVKIEPLSPYGISKYVPEHYLRIFASESGGHYTILRYANVYGPRQNASGEGGVVAIFSSRIAAGKPVTIFGNGEQTRDFIYVEDVAKANLAALHSNCDGVFNISTGVRISVNNLFDLFRQIAGDTARCEYAPPRPGEIMHSCLDPEKAKACLNWQAETDIFDGIAQTYKWFVNARV